MNVVLIGFMASGKSTIGRALARCMDIPFLDTDYALQRTYGMSVSELFASRGEDEFRRAETDLLAILAQERDLPLGSPRQFARRYVLSTGGGIPLREENLPLLKRLGHVVWLRAKVETIASRCRPHMARRPLLHGHEDDLEDHIKRLMKQRESAYRSLADSVFWTDDETEPEQIARRIRATICKRSS